MIRVIFSFRDSSYFTESFSWHAKMVRDSNFFYKDKLAWQKNSKKSKKENWTLVLKIYRKFLTSKRKVLNVTLIKFSCSTFSCGTILENIIKLSYKKLKLNGFCRPILGRIFCSSFNILLLSSLFSKSKSPLFKHNSQLHSNIFEWVNVACAYFLTRINIFQCKYFLCTFRLDPVMSGIRST
ncbi:hypothetical protein BpHYR1_004718 [Brachionus plicatilis]|uniref:Uncharacterized protein n=1 Tax=Brachionus plicatilis TaxID=10195 RepID=A0A3M7S619_BRAPC|nr:hypothetical protein BpHYR1_004718 [Brachionus plicatilis]